jgi:hypothetical protein
MLIAFSTGCGFLARGEPPVDRSQDPRIRAEVERRMASEPGIDAAAIRVEVDGAIVVLYGSVAGIDAWQCAIRNAQLVEGVRSVVDYLVIERGTMAGPCLAPRSGSAVTIAPGPYPAALPQRSL